MTDLIDQVRDSFEKAGEAISEVGGVVVVPGDRELAPGFYAMKEHYERQLLIIMRRAYRHHAGSELPTDGDELLEHTSEYLKTMMIAVAIGAFTDGVMIGHQTDHLVRMYTHFKRLNHLYSDKNFRQSSLNMAHGFAEDREVTLYFNEYVEGGVAQLAHSTGFAHSEVRPAKVWDLWLLVGTACVTASYLAGHRMGAAWLERDVLDGIEIASEPEGQDESDL